MKKQFIDKLTPGDSIDDIFILSEKKIFQKKDGNNFLTITISDKTGTAKGVKWDNVDELTDKIVKGDLVHIKGSVSEYNGALQVVVKKIEPCSMDDVDLSAFLPATKHDINGMFNRLLQIIESIETAYYKKLLKLFLYDEKFATQFKAAPAGKKMHHAYVGGLLEHSLSVAVLATKTGSHYSGIDTDLLITGAILHDLGKTKEFTYETSIDYSDEGRLLNHIVIGVEMINEKIIQIDDFPEEKALLLKHMIVSHHGNREFGSPEPPKTIEAVILNHIDEIDSKVNGIRQFMEKESPNETWTSYHRLLERYFYIGRKTTSK